MPHLISNITHLKNDENGNKCKETLHAPRQGQQQAIVVHSNRKKAKDKCTHKKRHIFHRQAFQNTQKLYLLTESGEMNIQSPDVTDSFHDHDHCQSEQVRTVLRVGQGADLDKYILKLTQIHLEIWTNIFSNSGRASATSSTSGARSPTRRTCCEKPDIFNC